MSTAKKTTDTPVTERPKVSVLIPVYNVEALLPRCLDSLTAQTLTDIEIVCVNDASPDGSAAILATYASRDPRIRIVTKQRNEGLMMARKTGYENATGDYLFFCDSDDYIPADTLERLYAAATVGGKEITVGAMYMINSKGETTLRPRTGIEGPEGVEYLSAILSGTTCSLCGSLYRRSLFEGHTYNGIMNQSFSEDRLLLTQLLLERRPSVGTIPQTTYFYWVNTESITRKTLRENALREQLTALFRCHSMVAEAAPDIKRQNDAFIIRSLSYYLEQVPWRTLIRDFNETSRHLLRYSTMKKTVSPHLALHTWMLLHIPPYRHIAWTGRGAIRKLQGKI